MVLLVWIFTVWSTTGLKNYWYSSLWLTYTVKTLYHIVQDTDIYYTLLYFTVRFFWLVLYSTEQHCTFLLTCTVQYWTTLYVSIDMHRTVLKNNVRFYWHALYSTEQCCTFWLTRAVQHWTTLYMILTCTVHYWAVQNGYTDTHCTQLYSTERGYRHTLYTTVQYSTHYNSILFYFF